MFILPPLQLQHSWVLQFWDSDPVPEHGVPPQAAFMRMDCERCWVPPPHVLEHDVQEVQAFHWQFWGQHWVLHVCVSLSLPPHGVPPFSDGTSIVLLRSWVPPPQVTEHVAHPLHWDHAQSTVNIVNNMRGCSFMNISLTLITARFSSNQC